MEQQNELIEAMKNSMNQRNESDMNTSVTPDGLRRAFYRTLN